MMATSSGIYYSASCDGCGVEFATEDHGVVLGKTAREVIDWAISLEDWLEYRHQLLCDGCVARLDAAINHDFVTTSKTEPFCRICLQLPDASHQNVPMLGQSTVSDTIERTP